MHTVRFAALSLLATATLSSASIAHAQRGVQPNAPAKVRAEARASIRPDVQAAPEPIFVLADRTRDGVTVVDLAEDPAELAKRVTGPASIAAFPLPDGQFIDLDLQRFWVTTPTTRFVVGRRNGPDIPLRFDHESIVFLRGTVRGLDGSHVFLSISPTAIIGTIDLGLGAGRYLISSNGGSQIELGQGQFAVFAGTAGVEQFPVVECGLDTSRFTPSPRIEMGSTIGRQQIEIAVETDYEFFTLFGDLTAAGTYVTQVYAAVSDTYIRDVNTSITLSFVRLWDDPNDLFNVEDPLRPFRDYWEANMGSVQRDVAQFFTGKRDLPYGGVAWLNGLCNSNSYSVAGYVLGRFASPETPSVFNRDVSVSAHEIGHNCGTPHTHDMGLDTCDNENSQPQRGTIMSYCGQTFTGGGANTDLRFHTVVQTVMESYIFSRGCVVDDCNGNGISDAIDINSGTSQDLNGNGIPDECEDCNGNGILDDQDIASGFSFDLNANGIPDECEPDCNNNGIPDDLDLLPSIGTVVFNDNFETNLGWTAENLGATSGDWQRGIPVNDPNWAYDPIRDSDGSGNCLLTQNVIGNTDVDNGAVRITSPVLDMSGGGLSLVFDYFLRLTNSNGTDRLLVEANDGSGWRTLGALTTDGALDWRTAVFSPAQFAATGLAQNSTMQFRFTANDGNPQSIVEAGIDAFSFAQGTFPPFSVDTNSNGIPDECEPDCDANGIMDYIQIQADMSLDLNRNIILDACEDCDSDGTPDLVALDHSHNVWIASQDHTNIREYLATVGTLTDVSDNAALGEGQDLIITADRRVLVSTLLDHRVVEFDIAGNLVGDLVPSGSGGLGEPAAMVVAPNGDLLVASRTTDAVHRYDINSGASLGQFVASGSGGLVNPFGLAFGPNGNLFVTAMDGRVLEYNGATGAFVGTFVTLAGNGGLVEPHGILFLPSDNLLVASYGSDTILEYDTNGTFVRQFNQGGTSNRLTLDQPWALRLGPDGDVYVSRAHDQEAASAPQPLHLTNARIYHFDVESGFFMRAYVLGVNSGILHPTGFDFVPDAGTDCNANLTPDNCDIASGFSLDVNNNGIPDECESACYADCDPSTGVGVLDLFDFLCFQSSFVSGESYACDCDTSTGPLVCDLFDFLCFQSAFVAGCP